VFATRILVVVAALTTGGLFALADPGAAWADPGRPDFQFFERPQVANNLKMGTLAGRVFSISDLKGKVVILNFWRNHCPYCEQEKRYFRKLMQQINRPDLAVVCVNLWDSPSWVRKSYSARDHGKLIFATKANDRRWVVENAVRGRIMGYYVVNEANEAIYEVKGFPTSYVINKEGRVVAAHMGMADWSSQWVTGWLSQLLGKQEQTGPLVGREEPLPLWIERLLTNPATAPPIGSPGSVQRAQFEPVRPSVLPR